MRSFFVFSGRDDSSRDPYSKCPALRSQSRGPNEASLCMLCRVHLPRPATLVPPAVSVAALASVIGNAKYDI